MPTNPGTLIFDLNERLLYFNLEAWDLLAPPQTASGKGGTAPPIPDEIVSLVQKSKNRLLEGGEDALRHVDAAFLNSHPRTPLIRSMIIGSPGLKRLGTHIMILITLPSREEGFDFEKTGEMFFLSLREIEVARLVYQGNGNQDIANLLFISRYTVKDHMKHIMRKMGVSSRQQIITKLATQMLADQSSPHKPQASPEK